MSKRISEPGIDRLCDLTIDLARDSVKERRRLERYEKALLSIKHMDVLTREGETEPQEVMRQIATEALGTDGKS